MFARPCLCPIDRLDFLACVFSIPFVHDILERNKVVVAVCTVIAVVNCDETDIVLRK